MLRTNKVQSVDLLKARRSEWKLKKWAAKINDEY